MGGDSFFINSKRLHADAWFICEDVWDGDRECTVPENQIYFVTLEASYHLEKFLNTPSQEFFGQFSGVHSCHPIDVSHYRHSPPFLPWMINANHGTVFSPHQRDINELLKPIKNEKSRRMSMICSTQRGTPEHRLRFAFAQAVNREFGDLIDWFGNGVNPVEEKWNALAPYSRTIVLENRFAPGVFTEKIVDAFLAESVPLYWGAPDIQKYLPVRDTHRLNLYDFAGSLQTIEQFISDPVSRQEQSDLAIGKAAALSGLHFLRRISKIAHEQNSGQNAATRKVQLHAADSFVPSTSRTRINPVESLISKLSPAKRAFFRGGG